MRNYSDADIDSIVSDRLKNRMADISRGISGRIAVFQSVYCDLGTAQQANNARKISVPFRSIFVRSATDSSAVVYFSPNDNAIGNIAESMPLYKNDSFDFGSTISSGYIWWPAQSGKTITLFLSTEGQMQPGSQISQISGGLSVSDGSSLISNGLSGSVATLSFSAVTKILDSDTDRKLAELYFDNDVWVGDSTSVAAGTRGRLVSAGEYLYRNTAALYASPVAGTVNVYGNVHK